jgi:hypothetical protein
MKKMNNRDLLAALLVTIVRFCLSSTVALAQDLLDERSNPVLNAAPQLTRMTTYVYEGLVGRLLQRHGRRIKKNNEKMQVEENMDVEKGAANEHDARQLGTNGDEINTNLSFEFNSLSCVSIIAVDAFRQLSANSSGITQSSFNYYPDSDAVVPFEFSSQNDTDRDSCVNCQVGLSPPSRAPMSSTPNCVKC